jgi:chromosome segregation ATPase
MANLLQLANKLKTEIDAKNASIVGYNKGLISKVQAMNNTAAQILEKIRNISGISQGLQQNIVLQAAEIEELKKQLQDAGKTQAAKQVEIDNLQKAIAQAQGQGSEILKQQLVELQKQAKVSNYRIQMLTKDITDATQEIQKLLGSLNSPQAQQSNAELSELIVQLEKHINDINSNMPMSIEERLGNLPSGLIRDEIPPQQPAARESKGGYIYKKNRPRSSSANFPFSYSKKNSFNKRSTRRGGSMKKTNNKKTTKRK